MTSTFDSRRDLNSGILGALLFSRKAIEKLRYYVYLYIDPRNEQPFYIGKGRGNRCFSHLRASANSQKGRILRELRKLGLKPRIDILKWDLSEEQALLVESTAIDLIDVRKLTNEVRGNRSRYCSRGSMEDISRRVDPKPVKVTDPAVLIVLTRGYRHDITPIELYDCTRSAWKMRPAQRAVKYALSVFEGVVREVYEIELWVPGGSTMRAAEPARRRLEKDRWEFVGVVAEERIRRKYVGKSVARYFPRGAQNPIRYVGAKV